MNRFIDTALTYSRSVLSAFLVVIIAGTIAYISIPKEVSPDIPIPYIYVSMVHEGISPEDAERLLVKPMETELRNVDGVKEMTATAREGGANIILEFDAGFDVDQAIADVRAQVDLAKAKLPDETEEPTVHEININQDPIIVVNLLGNVPERALVRLARDLRDRIEGLPGILEANLRGEREELIEVIIDPARLQSYNINQDELIRAVLRNNRLVAAGTLDTGRGRFAIKVPGLFETARDVLELPVKTNGDAVVTLADVTEIRRTFKDRLSYARINGKPSVSIEVFKRTGANLIQAVDTVRAEVEEARAQMPPNVEVKYTFDQAIDLKSSLNNLENSVISAILLVAIVIVAALGARSAGLVGIAIPTSFLFGFLVLSILGLTINQVILFGLILAVGMLVDGAIVVTEYADRKMAEGLDRRDAYATAAKRMAWPITASTATTLAAFLPLMFWPGIVGEFMWYLPLTLIVTLTGSLISALIFLPTLGAKIGRPSTTDPAVMRAVAASSHGDLSTLPGFTGWYVRTLRRLLRRPLRVLAVAAVVLVGTWGIYLVTSKGVEFFPQSEPTSVRLLVHARGNLSIDERDALVREVEAIARGIDGVDTIYATTQAGSAGNRQAEDLIGNITLELVDWERRRPAKEILAELRQKTGSLAGIVVEPHLPQNGPRQGKDIEIRVSSADPSLIPLAVDRIRTHMEREMTGLVDIEDDRSVPGIQWELRVDRAQASRFGADIVTVGSAVQLITNGIKVGEIRPDDSDDEIDIRVRFPEDARTINQLDQLRVETARGMVPISNFVTRTPKPKIAKITRIDGHRVMTVKANVADGVLADNKVRELQAWLASAAKIDPRVRVVFAGQDRDQRESSAFLRQAFLIALFLMAIILVTQFNSFYHAFLILTAVVLSTVGVLVGLIVTGRTFVIVMTGIGVISLAGIVVNNNIVLIDTFARLRREGYDLIDAILRTGAQRLRPVLLTTITTVTGLLPMVFSTNIDLINRHVVVGDPDSIWWVDLSLAIVFGLSFATVLTLVVTPCLLAAPAAIKGKVAALRHRRRARSAAAAGQPAE